MPSNSGKKLKMSAILSITETRVVMTRGAATHSITSIPHLTWVDLWWMNQLELLVDPVLEDPAAEEKSLVILLMMQSLAAARAHSHLEIVYSWWMEDRLDNSIRVTHSRPI
jgi:hypothetical protein